MADKWLSEEKYQEQKHEEVNDLQGECRGHLDSIWEWGWLSEGKSKVLLVSDAKTGFIIIVVDLFTQFYTDLPTLQFRGTQKI